MNESKISVRYAKALFELGKEQNMIETFIADIKVLDDLIKESAEFWLMIESPVVKTLQKRKVIKQIFTDKVNNLTLNFLDLVLKNRREIYLKDISRNFQALCRKNMGILSATLTSASKVADDSKVKLVELMEKSFNSKIELTEIIDEEIIGGFIIRLEDQQLDASVANQLNQIKRELLTNRIS